MSFGSENPFDSTDLWEVSEQQMFPVGTWVTTITEADDGTAKSSGNPQIDLKFENDTYYIRAWEAYHADFLNRVASLYVKSGTKKPQPGEFDPNDKFRISEAAIRRLVGRKVAIVVREEADNMNPGKTRTRVHGYLAPNEVKGGGGGGGSAAQPATAAAASSSRSAAEDEIPF